MRGVVSVFVLLFGGVHATKNRVGSPKVSPVRDVLYRGSTAPFPEFNPLGFNEGANQHLQPAFVRESELKHSRIAMVATSIIPTVEKMTGHPAIHEFGNLPDASQLSMVSAILIFEFGSMFLGWKDPWTSPFELKEDYQFGDLGFKTASREVDDETYGQMMDMELNHGRLAMLGAAGMIAQELVTNQAIFL